MSKCKECGQTGPVTYSLHETIIIKVTDLFYLLAQVGESQVAAIRLSPPSNRFSDPVFVKNITRITTSELDRVVGNGQYDYDVILGATVLVGLPDATKT